MYACVCVCCVCVCIHVSDFMCVYMRVFQFLSVNVLKCTHMRFISVK